MSETTPAEQELARAIVPARFIARCKDGGWRVFNWYAEQTDADRIETGDDICAFSGGSCGESYSHGVEPLYDAASLAAVEAAPECDGNPHVLPCSHSRKAETPPKDADSLALCDTCQGPRLESEIGLRCTNYENGRYCDGVIVERIRERGVGDA